MRYTILIAVLVVAGCQPAQQPREQKSPWVITEVHHYEPAPNVTPPAPNTAKPAPNTRTTACECTDCQCDPCECRPTKDTSHDPKAVPVPDFYGTTKDARDVLNESKPVRVQEPQSTDGSKPTAGTPDAGGTYYEAPRRGLFRGRFRGGGG